MKAKAIATVILLCIVTLAGFACGGDGGEETPTPTPTQDKVAFVSDRDGNDEIYGSDQTRLTNNPAKEEMSSWSP